MRKMVPWASPRGVSRSPAGPYPGVIQAGWLLWYVIYCRHVDFGAPFALEIGYLLQGCR